ncbi:hypothetical protein SPRG_08948 [Saprolegnia parasitica CBS 223.65]|uniref:Helicase-associated domain-containing protein n=1 Tax=Saprolegnia parasitica (strain CBS 223.65) TaxID=695850 RepID=A0A067C4F5_SAPPC|nr:hypothetical protein SPRG_08948 [Saprolegnia parasitica CBS 223.65]KDO25649.1 hypothetical protein SPRG_08948 [Saprolegnia parasitica CBS 223.65]|eukprot:XP_012203680.1 hypothetical protein SPRG_08948 [Saprolegnia parasitica CBS 223.65]
MQQRKRGGPRQLLELVKIAHAVQSPTSSYTYLPRRYTVPAEAPWPTCLRGKVVNLTTFCAAYAHRKLPPSMQSALDAMNFVSDLRELRWAQHLMALRAYKAISGDLDVPADFVVPSNDAAWPRDVWGVKLGRVLSSLRAKITELPDARQRQLQSIGLLATYDSWYDTLLALQVYKNLHGHMRVPRTFEVPTDSPEWPDDLWRMKLGMKVTYLRARAEKLDPAKRAQLDDLGFLWRGAVEWDLLLEALTTYKSIFGHTRMPPYYTIPASDPQWPPELWHLPLGEEVHALQTSTALTWDQVTELEALGVLGILQPKTMDWPTKLAALTIYHGLHGHANVPHRFKVPDRSALWPQRFWQLKLGAVVQGLRHGPPLSADKMDALANLGFAWTVSAYSWENKLLALHSFGRLHGHLMVPSGFMVPSDQAWPASTWALKLGHIVSGLRRNRRRLTLAMRAQLDALGFLWHEALPWTTFVAAVAAFHALHGHANVPSSFVVPASKVESADSEEAMWPADAAGLPIGRSLRRLRSLVHAGFLDATKKAALEAVGVRWRHDATTAVPIHAALVVYQRVHGHVRVPPTFVVPTCDSAWPSTLRRFRLGAYVELLRCAQDGVAPSVVHELTAMGLMHWSSAADAQWTTIFAALSLAKTQEGHLDLPPRLLLPVESDMSSAASTASLEPDTAGLDVGGIVARLRALRYLLPRDRRRELEALGFQWSSPSVADVLSVYGQIHGDANVPPSYCVPTHDLRWPVEMAGFPLSYRLQHCVAANAASDVVALGYSPRDEPDEAPSWATEVAALQLYMRHNRSPDVPSDFVVPSDDDSSWPPALWRLPLGALALTWHASEPYLSHAQWRDLTDAGFLWAPLDVDYDVAYAALATYARLSTPWRDVDWAFSVPTGDAAWPSETWGLRLGFLVAKLRANDVLLLPNEWMAIEALGVLDVEQSK